MQNGISHNVAKRFYGLSHDHHHHCHFENILAEMNHIVAALTAGSPVFGSTEVPEKKSVKA
jgi:hypothetical protein